MLEFATWLPLHDAKRHLGLALVAQNNNASGMEILPHINSFRNAISRCFDKTSQNETLAIIKQEAEAAVSEPDPGLRRQMLSSLLIRMEALDS